MRLKRPDEKILHEMIKQAIEPKLKEQFNLGLIAGWDACVATIYKACKDLTSAQAIKEYLKSKTEEKHKLPGLYNDENSD